VTAALRDALIILGLVLGYLTWVHGHAYRECRWCRKGGLTGGSVAARVAGHKPGRRRRGRCWRCHGRRLTRRWAAWATHKLAVSLREAWGEWRDR
jgi:hypothetical protein